MDVDAAWLADSSMGIGVGGEVRVAAVYINELSKSHGRGRFFMP